MGIIKSLLETDFYKFAMLQVFFHKFPFAYSKYRFKLRNAGINLLPYKDRIIEEIKLLCRLKFTQDELTYLRNATVISDDMIDFLEDFQLKERFVTVKEKDGKLDISFKGPLIQVMMFEIYILKIVHEVYSEENHPFPDYTTGDARLSDKIQKIKKYVMDGGIFKLVDFGTRRAFTSHWHDHVVYVLKCALPEDVFVGTSNVHLAKRYDLKCIGTFAHEFVQAFQGLGECPLQDSQKMALQTWADEYRGDLGISLTDTLGLKKFIKDFDKYFAKLYDGVRHDSGDPFKFVDSMVEHYTSLGIDAHTKTIVFSDGLNVDLAIELAEYCKGKIQCVFGIGTNLTNDLGYDALQIVIKMIECGKTADTMYPVAKLAPSKEMCEDLKFLNYIRYVSEGE